MPNLFGRLGNVLGALPRIVQIAEQVKKINLDGELTPKEKRAIKKLVELVVDLADDVL